ncbi:3-isopropylmalate dehydratase small subunit [Candidatus Desulfarcum epimagneticum]|uniref:3-isopropylmalate dehydratase small subunit n=1 Tax=uncultured Desulfobacteraceae bacterium TaxID=218296 RepID=A0A484HJM3_9BACT|nr:3-isopropylmalate dehydratase small subunit [uncultured Desulfobacteraceae bacterium]
MAHKGHAWTFGDDIDTDAIVPAAYLNSSDPGEFSKYCMEGARPGFARLIAPGDIIAAGKNFGSGSSREHAPMALKAAGIACVAAVSFARIFYRNAFNIGLPILECREAKKINEGDLLKIDFDQGRIANETSGETYRTHPIPPFMRSLLESGGLIRHIMSQKRP